MGASLDIHNDCGYEVEVELVHPQNQRKKLAPDEIWTLKRRKTDTRFYVLVTKNREKGSGGKQKKDDKKQDEKDSDDKENWRELITEYQQELEITPQMGNKGRFSVSQIIRHTERKKRSAAIREEIMSVNKPCKARCRNMGTRWLNCSGAVRKRLQCEEEGITYQDYKREDRAHLQKTVEQIALDLRRTTPQSFRIRNKRVNDPEDEKDIEKREWFEAMEKFHGGRKKFVQLCNDILIAFVQRNVSLGYAQGLNYIVYFLLAFMDEESTFWLLCTMVEDIRLPDFYAPVPSPLNGFQIEAKTLLEVAEITERNAVASRPVTREQTEKTDIDHSGQGGIKHRSSSAVTGILSSRATIFTMLTGRRQDLKTHILDAEDENCERIGGDLGVLYQKTTEWMIPMFLTVAPLHPCIMIVDNFFDLYPDLEDAYPDPQAASLVAKKQGSAKSEAMEDVQSPTEEAPTLDKRVSSTSAQDAWALVEDFDVAPRIGSGESMVYCTFLTTIDLIKSRLEDTEDYEARESFSKLFDAVALGITCGDLKHGIDCYAKEVGERQLLPLRAKYRNRLADRWNKSTQKLPMLCDDLKRCYQVETTCEFLKELHEDFQYLYKKSEPGMSRTEFGRFLLNFPTLFPKGKGAEKARSKRPKGRSSAIPHSLGAPEFKRGMTGDKSADSAPGDRVIGRVDVLQAIFNATDGDKGGYVNFKEFVCTMAILCAKNRIRYYRLIFDSFDDTGSAYLNYRNLMEIARWLVERKFADQKKAKSKAEATEQRKERRKDFRRLVNLLRGLDKSGNRKLSFTEFSKGLEATPIINKRIFEFQTSMEEVKERLDFRVKVKKEKSQLDINISSLEGLPPSSHVRCVLSVEEKPVERRPKIDKKAQDKGRGEGERKNSDASESPRSSMKSKVKARVLWGPWETKYRSADKTTGKVDVNFATHMTMEYGKPLDRLQVAIRVTKKAGVVFSNEEKYLEGTYNFGALPKEICEKQEPFDVTIPVVGSKVSAKANFTFCYKKEWDEEVKRNKQALENIQALFGTQMI